MPATLTITLPDEVLARLRQRAIAEGKSAEVMAAEALQKTLANEPGGFLDTWAGAINSKQDCSDWADQHDKHIGDAELRTMTGTASDETVR